uniref:Reverse transcriptase domain-containing protein n=1 Tax=Fagus sylvatica TaxID=28930 RepID=A0A2N9IAB2_FAGSY
MQQGGSSSQTPSEKNTSVASSLRMTWNVRKQCQSKKIRISMLVGIYQHSQQRAVINLEEKPYETTRVYIGKKPKRKNQAKSKKLTEEAVTETAKSDLVEAEKIEAVDTNIEAEEDFQEDEDDDGEKFALSIGAVRKEEDTQTENNMQEDDQDQETNTNIVDCNMVYVLPREFISLERLELEENEDREETRGEIQKAQGATPVLLVTENEGFEAGKMVFEKPSKQMTQHLKPLYIKAHMNGRPVNKVLVDNGAIREPTLTKGIIPIQIKVGSKVNTAAFFVVNTKSAYNALLGRDWIHSNWVVPSSLHQNVLMKQENEDQTNNGQECVNEQENEDQANNGQETSVLKTIKTDSNSENQDPLIEVNLGTKEEPRVTFMSGHLGPEEFARILKVLKKYKDCFAWSYTELPGLNRRLVEHRLPIKAGFEPYQQAPRRMAPDIILKVKEEIKRLVAANFIRPIRYVKWLSNIVPMMKKNGKLIRICVDFRNLNNATPKDEYPMPMADLLIDGVAGYQILSMMDGHSGYNQIFIAEEDVHKTAFRCPGSIGTFEWIVMPFGLKNAGATYQRAINFSKLIYEVYIDDLCGGRNNNKPLKQNNQRVFGYTTSINY